MNWIDHFTSLSDGIKVKRYILTIAVCVTVTRDLETESHVLVYVTNVIFACINFVLPQWLFLVLSGFHVKEFILTIAPCVTITCDLETQGQFMVYVTFYFCLFLFYRNDFFCYLRSSGQEIHSNYCQLRDYHVWPWNARSIHGLAHVTYYFCLFCYTAMIFFVSSGLWVMEFIRTIANCVFFTYDFHRSRTNTKTNQQK